METDTENENEDTLDLSWLQEEEALIHMDTVMPKTSLEHIELRVFFVDIHMCLREIPPRKVDLVVLEGKNSILSKDRMLKLIETAKREYTEVYASSGVFTLLDILIWNMTAGTDHLQPFVDTGCSAEFIHGSLFSDIVLEPSLSIFHSEQCIFLFLRECNTTATSSKLKQTKRVRFHAYAGNTTRKMIV